MYWPFETKTPSQSEIFFCYCSFFCIFAIQDQHTLPKWNIFSNLFSCLFSLLVCMYWPFRSKTPSQSEIFYVIVASSVYWPFKTSTPSQSEIFFQSYSLACSLSSYVCIGLARPPLKGQYTEQATITILRKYSLPCFTLGGSTGHERPIHTYEQREQATK